MTSFWQHLTRLLRGLATATCVAAALSLLGFLALRARFPDQPQLALLSAGFPFLLALLLLLLLLLALLARSRLAWACALLPVAVFAWHYGAFFLPRAPAPAATPSFTMMTYNVGADRCDPENIATAILAANADIVAVEELTARNIETLRQRLRGHYPHIVMDIRRGTTGLLSRYPISSPTWFRPAGSGRVALLARVEIQGVPTHVLAVHPMPPDLQVQWVRGYPIPTGLYEATRQQELADIAQRIAGLEGPVLLAGDFNMTDQSPAYAPLARLLHDSYRQSGCGLGWTFPNRLRVNARLLLRPLVRIDYIFHGDELRAEEAQVRCEGCSDHCALVVTFRQISRP